MPDRLSSLDAAFLNIEQPHAPMHVAGLYVFEGRPEKPGRPGLPGIFKTIEERIHLVPRYRQVVRSVPLHLAHPVWVDDPNFDLSYHLRRAALPAPGGHRELLEYVARVHARPLDRNHPLWEMYIIEGLEGGRLALYTKTHHAMIDGMSAVDLATILLDFDPDGWRPNEVERFEPPPAPSGRRLLQAVALEAAGRAAGLVRAAAGDPLGMPRRLAGEVIEVSGLRRLADLVLRPVPPGPLNVRVGPNRRIATLRVDLARAKAIKNALGGTVNDVILAAVAESVRLFLEHRGEAADELTYRIMVPVSVRDESQRMALGNRVSAIFVHLPVGRMPVRRRLEIIRAETSGLKETRQALAAEQLLDVTAWAPATLHALAGRLEFTAMNQRVINFVVSNVPGMQVPMYAGGSRLLEAYPLLPLGVNLAVVMCVTSYNGGMYFGIVGDHDHLPDLQVLADGIDTGFERLERAAGIEVPPRPRVSARNGHARRPARRVARVAP
ncbi:MAG TPA: wax ester/triacylglycerol synthase family O-acyltransferase [Candidatus Dormibacteraeota bacterium]|jgi:WS/DGAT/MGAT family acyltransferase|nr:wax ester/triacylglycerol synthase family O-acyltransferase [Candidatus Dormibacteraeota bacterium]